jgi:hypothetical protein
MLIAVMREFREALRQIDGLEPPPELAAGFEQLHLGSYKHSLSGRKND